MKKLTRFLSALLAVTMLLALVPFTALAASTALKGKTIIALGDSMTRFGTTASGATSSTGEKTYPYYLSTNDYLGVPVINAGVGGDTTKHVMARFKTDVLDKKPDIVIICIGMNDQANVISSGQPNVSLDMYRSNLDYFIKEIKNIGGEAVIVTPSPVNTNSGYYVAGAYGLDYGGKHMVDFCNAMREVAIENGCSVVDIQAECAYEDMNKFAQYGDGIHHSDYGRKQYAKYISEHMLAVYDNQNKATMTVKCVDEKGNTLKTVTHVGAAGAHITLASPEIAGYVSSIDSLNTTFVDGATHTFTYSLEIYDAIEQAEKLIAYNYSNEIISLIRENVAIAKNLVAADAPDTAQLIACSDTLTQLIAASENNTYVVSAGASYTTTAPNRGDIWDDDGIRLTDGEKDTPDGGTSRYSGWNSTTFVNIDIDLGENKAVNSFSAYCASDGGYGIKKPAKLTVYISDDGASWTELTSQTNLKTTFNLVGTKKSWDTTVITAVSDEIVETRYVRFSIVPNGSFVWVSEVEAALRTYPADSNVFVTGFNRKVAAGDCVVFTDKTITASAANFNWCANAVAEWSETENAYIVKKVINNPGTNPENIVLADGQILISAHSDEKTAASILNKQKIASLEVGQKLSLNGINAESGELDVLPYVSIADYKGEPELENGQLLWLTHFNSNSVEGAGTIFTNEYSGCAWWLNVSFKPVEGLDGVYEVVAKSDGASVGGATPLPIPEGGFVYAVNNGNNYVNINSDEHDANFSNKASSNMIATARTWKVGDKIRFSGLNLVSQRIPTTTEYIDYYSPNYVCNARFEMYNDGSEEDDTEKTPILVSHVNLYNWGTFESMIISGDDKTVVDVINQKPQYWIVYTVENVDGKYIATNYLKNSEECYKVKVPAGGFLFYIYNTNSAYALADNGALLGYEFDLNGLDIKNKLAIDTTTSSAMTIYVIAPETTPDPDPDPNPDPDIPPVVEPEIKLGDVNNDGAIDQFDYILVKRHYFETRLLTDDELPRADVNGDEVIDQFDYILIKRHYFGTYTIG